MPALALVVLALAHAFDYASFLALIARHGLAAEANPVVVSLTQEMGLPGLTLAKVVSVVFAASLVTVLASRRRNVAILVLVFGIAVGVIGGLSNIAAL